MAFYGVTFTYDHHENFDAFLRAVGVPEDKIAAIDTEKPTTKLTKNGDTYTLTTSGPKGTKDSTFKSGVEFDDVLGDDNYPVKSTMTVDGNILTQEIKSGLGVACFKREFSDNELVVTITSDKFEGSAKRYYKA